MNISRFFGSTNREALRQVRLALGPDALIVSNTRVNGGVEIMAADPTSVAAQADTATLRSPAAPAPGADLAREMSLMRGALEGRIDELMWGNQLKQSHNAAILFQSLLGCGFSTALLRAMLKRLPPGLSLRSAQEWVRNELTRNLPVLESEDALWTPGLTLALVGPTGVGKTTTIAKLAARAVKRHGSDGVALLTTDTYRIGAYEQLKIYGELLRVPVKVIQNPQELARTLELIPKRVTVLIDNVGVSQRDRYVAEQVAMLTGTNRDVKRLLVLNASSHGDTLDEVARSYSRDGGASLQGCVITKADEAGSLGAALDTAIRYRLPIHYVSNGQKVPEDMLHMTPDALVERAMVHEQDAGALYAPSQADFAALMSASQVRDGKRADASGSGVDQLLGTLLSADQHPDGAVLPHAFQAACTAIEDSLPVAEAWDVWRALDGSAGAQTIDAQAHLARMMRAVRISGNARPGRPVIAVHGETPLQTHGIAQGALRASLLFDHQGGALVSALRQVTLPQGWWASWGASAPQGPGPSQALAMQLDHLHVSRPDWSIVHVFDGGSQQLWRDTTDAGLDWMARIGAVTRLSHEGSRATASAIARALEHHTAPHAPAAMGIDGSAAHPVLLWVASAPVQLAGRNVGSAPLQLVSVKMAAPGDGRIIKHLYGIAHVRHAAADAAQLGVWLVNAYLARAVFRCAGRHGVATRRDMSGDQLLTRTLLSTQTALAAWELMREPGELAHTVARLAGNSTPSLTSFSAALTKLFAVKKWLDNSDGDQG